MVRASPAHGSDSPKRLTLGFLMSISAFVSRFARQAGRFKIKLKANNPKPINKPRNDVVSNSYNSIPPSPRSPLSARPKQLLASLSNKAITLIHHHKKKSDGHDHAFGRGSHDEFGDDGVWQRAILMGDKCQPLDFSGVIYYDSSGKQVDELPLRSPARASPLPGHLARKQEL